MHRRVIAAFVVALFALGLAGDASAENWPSWRGPRGDGTSDETNLPTEWNESEGKNLLWKVPLPGLGHASPVVWEDRIFVVTCVTAGGATPESAAPDAPAERVLLCLDRKDGRTLWQKTVVRSPLERKHKLNSHASGTPATDGQLVYVAFLDRAEMVVAAYDFSGKEVWHVRPGKFSSVHGFCSCPLLFEDLVIVNGDHDGDSYIVALQRGTGETVWKTPRAHKTRSYVTPIIRDIGGRTQMILAGDKSVTSYDPRSGNLHWYMDGPTEQFVASLVFNGKLLFLTAGYPEHHMLAIRADGSGNVTDTHVAWRTQEGASYVPSPIAVGDYFLVVSDGGIASCFVAATGVRVWKKRIGPHYSASLVTANGLVYFTDDNGVTKVVRPGREYEEVAEGDLDDYVYASPAISGGQVFVRGEKNLYCIGKSEAAGK
ncbi:MAG: PQQ-binding-like beta-propeller repeat protein [Planctomycetes bacterium]|nr:PQQ-binding-like beta-propeller repeat protein [Planctomycetota bacterium]